MNSVTQDRHARQKTKIKRQKTKDKRQKSKVKSQKSKVKKQKTKDKEGHNDQILSYSLKHFHARRESI
jgi:hypothetical protein